MEAVKLEIIALLDKLPHNIAISHLMGYGPYMNNELAIARCPRLKDMPIKFNAYRMEFKTDEVCALVEFIKSAKVPDWGWDKIPEIESLARAAIMCNFDDFAKLMSERATNVIINAEVAEKVLVKHQSKVSVRTHNHAVNMIYHSLINKQASLHIYKVSEYVARQLLEKFAEIANVEMDFGLPRM
jgi:hypothetical protein